MLAGAVKNQGNSQALNVEVSFYQGTEATGTLLGTVIVDDINKDETTSVELETLADLAGELVTMAVAIQSGEEFDTSNNAVSKTFETVDHAPQVIQVAPDNNETLSGNEYDCIWTADDADGVPLSVDIYLDTDNDQDNGRIPMALGLGNTGSATLNMSLVEAGVYYVSVTVHDDKNAQATGYSQGMLISADMDGDGVPDDTDNCPETSNEDQANSDDDHVGDACDDFPDDGTEWSDADNDGIGDNADPDDDNDGLDDTSESNYGTDPFMWDSDGDGYSDGEEVYGGSDPKNEYSIPGSSPIVGDIDGDGDVDGKDLAIFASAYNSVGGEDNYNHYADFDHDGHVDDVDLAVIAMVFGCMSGEPCYVSQADFDQDGDVDSTDLCLFAEAFNSTFSEPFYHEGADFDLDGDVDDMDLAIFAMAFGAVAGLQ